MSLSTPAINGFGIDINFNCDNTINTPCLCVPGQGYTCYFSVFSATVLCNLLDDRINDFHGYILKPYNPRVEISHKIQRAIINHPQDFMASSQGIIAIASSIFDEEGNSIAGYGYKKISKITSFYVIDGSQTIYSLYYTKKQGKAPIASVQVPVKIIVPDDNLSYPTKYFYALAHVEHHPEICSSGVHNVILESLSREITVPNIKGHEVYWFYERTEKQYLLFRNLLSGKKKKAFESQFPADKVFTTAELSKVWTSWKQHPEIVCKGSMRTMAFFYAETNNLLPDSKQYKDSVALIILYRYLLSLSGVNNSIAAYSIAMLGWLNNDGLLDTVWESQSVPDNVIPMLQLIVNHINKEFSIIPEGMVLIEYLKKSQTYSDIRESFSATVSI